MYIHLSVYPSIYPYVYAYLGDAAIEMSIVFLLQTGRARKLGDPLCRLREIELVPVPMRMQSEDGYFRVHRVALLGACCVLTAAVF